MTAAHARRPTAQGAARMASPTAADLIGMFAQRNPTSNRGELAEVGKLVAEFSATAARLSPAARKRLVARKAQFKTFIAEIAAEPGATSQTLPLVAKSAAEVSQGAGLGQVLSAEAGRAWIAAYATPAKVEDWAGPLAGPTALERDFGVARSTLHNWQKQGGVIGLLVGVRKHAFPTEQFVDGRPIAGLGPVVEAIGEPRTAWLWLREPNPELGGAAPLARLKAGAIDKVVGSPDRASPARDARSRHPGRLRRCAARAQRVPDRNALEVFLSADRNESPTPSHRGASAGAP